MEGILQVVLFSLCLLAPITLIAIIALSWMLKAGTLSLPGIGETKGNWTSVPLLAGGMVRFLAAVCGGVGSIVGFLGFLLPWFSLEIGGGVNILDQSLGASIGGQMSGIASAFYSLVAGFKLLGTSDADSGTIFLGLFLIVFGLLVFVIPVVLGILAAMGIGLLASPLDLVKIDMARLSRMMLFLSLAGSCLICLVFSILQATIGGIGITGSAGNVGTLAAGVVPAYGLFLTIGGLLLTIFSAVLTITIASRIEEWIKRIPGGES
jgi:hypothetical protein